nr:sugar phosphate isomerase/epimerase family protein [Cohnella sp. WQ 127256]
MVSIGLSTYCLAEAIKSGDMTVLEVIQWIAENGGEHVEITPIGYSLEHNDALVDAIVQKANEVNLPIAGYAITANFIQESKDDYEAEIARVKHHVDIAHRLGVKLIRHDVASRALQECSIVQFEADMDIMVQACRVIADYAAQYSIITSVENHGFYIQASDRVQRIIHAVDRPNFQTTLDIGNFMCVDEDPVVAVKKNISYASTVHLKDFYVRPSYQHPGEGWFQSRGGNFLRGAIFGQGDIDVREIIRIIKRSGYSGYISIEFEGMEDCRKGSRIALDNVKRLWNEV